jgi:DNA mismatch endonuclease Vsr
MPTSRFVCSSRRFPGVTDVVDKATRSRIMSRVRSKDTRLEIAFRQALWAAGLRGWRCNVRRVTGTPDVAWQGRRVAVFVDSAWWHGHPSRWRPGRHAPAWDHKIKRNRRRDAEVNRVLAEEGWTVIRIWDFEFAEDPDGCVERVRRAYAATRSS